MREHAPRHSLFDDKDDFTNRVAPLGMAAIYFGSFTLAPQDAALTRQALYKLSFLFRHFLQPAGLRIVVQRETAILSGTATPAPLLIMANILARQIEGILEVKNENEKSASLLSETRTAKEALQLLFATDQTLRSSVQVSIREGRLTLEGEVGSAAQKTWAEKLAAGISAGIDSRLQVSDAAALAHAAPITSIEMDDESLQALVLLRLRLIRETELLAVKVQARRGILTLQGKVRTEVLRQGAENIARSTLGLTELRSSLAVAA